MDMSTIYLIMAMGGFLLVAMTMIHHHNCSQQVHRKKGELDSVTQKLNPRIEILEKEVAELKVKIDEVDVEITTYQ